LRSSVEGEEEEEEVVKRGFRVKEEGEGEGEEEEEEEEVRAAQCRAWTFATIATVQRLSHPKSSRRLSSVSPQ
jgi:hypothetical protein